MSTTQTVATLYQLQQLDLELERLSAEQQAVTSSLQGNAELQKLHAEHNRAQKQIQAGLQAQEQAEQVLEDLARRLKTQEQRLYSGAISNPKELNALQQEMQRLRLQHSHQEEVTLEAMDAAESLQEQAHRASVLLQQAEEAWTAQHAALVTRRDQIETRRQEVQVKRAQVAARLNADLLSRYDNIRRTRQGKAVSKVEQSSCQWCRVILTPSELQHARMSTELQTCSNCGRILYFDR